MKGSITNPGAVVEIYSQPLTGDELEGRARLVRLISAGPVVNEAGERLERWLVRFDGEADVYERAILAAPADSTSPPA